jgi:tripartite-type tricarboxylate transporter receptor subunit TctC
MNFATRILAALLIVLASCAQAQTYPNRPVKLVVPFPPGGSGDLVGRLIGMKLTEAWGQQIVIDFKPGATGNIGAEVVARSPADGYTLMLGIDTQMVINPHFFRKLPYDPDKDFAPVVPIVFIGYVLLVHPSIPGNTLSQVIAHFKANPGKYSYASLGIGSIHHLSTEMLKHIAGVNLVHVPYKGAAQTLIDLIGGEIQLVYTGIPQAMPHVKSGKAKAIALGSGQRLDAMPGVPTIGETYPGFETTSSWNIFAPTGTPSDVVMKVNTEVNRILARPDVRERLNSNGLFVLGGSPEKLAATLKADYQKWGAVIRSLNLKPE